MRAKRLLSEAGYPNGFEAEFSTESTPIDLQFAQLLQAQLKRINVNITINPVDPTDIYTEYLSQRVLWGRTDSTCARTRRPAADPVLYGELRQLDRLH